MDDKDLNSQVLEDFKKFYSFMLANKGSVVWFERVHCRQKTIEEKINLSSPFFLQYKEDKEKEIKLLEEKINQLEDKEKEIKLLEEKINQLEEKNKSLTKTVLLKDEEAEAYLNYSVELEKNDTLQKNEIKNLKTEIQFLNDSIKNNTVNNSISTTNIKNQHPESHILSRGKALELPLRSVREVVRLYCIGSSIKEIEAETGAERRQINRIIKGQFKHPKSKEKVLKAVNQLLKVNQNKEMLEKLKELKAKYT